MGINIFIEILKDPWIFYRKLEMKELVIIITCLIIRFWSNFINILIEFNILINIQPPS